MPPDPRAKGRLSASPPDKTQATHDAHDADKNAGSQIDIRLEEQALQVFHLAPAGQSSATMVMTGLLRVS